MSSKSQQDAKRVLLVDDHPLVRQALRETLAREPNLAVCGEAEDRDGTLAAIEACRPDLAIVDVGLKNSDGIRLIQDIQARYPRVLMLVLSMHDESLYAERAIRAGANGYISKQEPPEKIMQAIRTVLAGEIYWGEKIAAQVASKVARSSRRLNNLPPNVLSERELQVFELIGSGVSTSAIAATLHIGVSTVETHRSRIREKMNLKDAGELLQVAIRWNVASGNCSHFQGGEADLRKPVVDR
ncbi:MAG: response regulator [Limisphaerales bacterium]